MHKCQCVGVDYIIILNCPKRNIDHSIRFLLANARARVHTAKAETTGKSSPIQLRKHVEDHCHTPFCLLVCELQRLPPSCRRKRA